MPDLELTRSPDDRRLYVLEGVGTLRFEGYFSRAANAETAGGNWRLARRGIWGRVVEAADPAGTVVGGFRAAGLRRGGTLRWTGRELALRPASAWRQRYAVADSERELALLDGKGWGKRPVKVTVEDPDGAVEPGLLLLAAFVVRGLAEDAGGGTSAG